MKIVKTHSELNDFYQQHKIQNQIIGFVPTMGALHEGHGSLVTKAKLETDFVIVSIFINPTQFNKQSDFEKYPITIEKDILYLEELNCDLLFLPTVEEIYPKEFVMPRYDIGALDQIMEGKHRPGHFNGVAQVVYRLFDILKPTKAYFGLKDFQQVAVIKNMVNYFKLPVEIIPCTTVREKDGLAMSSRNLRLSAVQRFEALFIYQSLILAKNLRVKLNPNEVKAQLVELYQNSSLELEYIEIIDPVSFDALHEDWVEGAVACIVAYVGEIRLIDNMRL